MSSVQPVKQPPSRPVPRARALVKIPLNYDHGFFAPLDFTMDYHDPGHPELSNLHITPSPNDRDPDAVNFARSGGTLTRDRLAQDLVVSPRNPSASSISLTGFAQRITGSPRAGWKIVFPELPQDSCHGEGKPAQLTIDPSRTVYSGQRNHVSQLGKWMEDAGTSWRGQRFDFIEAQATFKKPVPDGVQRVLVTQQGQDPLDLRIDPVEGDTNPRHARLTLDVAANPGVGLQTLRQQLLHQDVYLQEP
ncbi:MAG: hypothetical protein ACYCW6_12595 [Candidatus Xenobia bacterium]